jgi:hypothetical protein
MTQKLQVKTWDRFERFADAAHHSTLRITPEDLRMRWTAHLPEAEQDRLLDALEDRSYISFTDSHGRYNQLSKAPVMSPSMAEAIREDAEFEWRQTRADDIEAGMPWGWR